MRGWVRRGSPPTWSKGRRARVVDPCLPHLRRRLEEGAIDATALWRKVRVMGFPGRVADLRAVVAGLRGGPAHRAARAAPPWRRPSPRQATRALPKDDGTAGGRIRRFLEGPLEVAPVIRRAVKEARAFVRLLREREAEALDPWLASARGGPLAGLVEGLRRDHDAVAAVLVLPWGTEPMEGQIGRLKTIKRRMCGRAGLDLLRARVVAA